MTPPTWSLTPADDHAFRLELKGDWILEHARQINPGPVLAAIGHVPPEARLTVDADGLGRWDSGFMTFLLELKQSELTANRLVLEGLPAGISALLELASAVPEREGARRRATSVAWLANLGELGQRLGADGRFLTRFLGETMLAGLAFATGRARFRRIDLWLQIQECGPSALPIVTLISLLVGLILAFVGAVQLALFGAEIYIADLVALGMTREMGALMTAIIMSGRSGAAFAAQIGTMNVNMEISALRVMGFDPVQFLVLPRMLALILVMPILCVYADLMGIIGGGIVSIAVFDIPMTQLMHRTAESVHLTDFLVGVFKCGLFGILVALAGCMRGVQCGRSASAVGDAATSAVVTSIVFIVVADSIVTLICDRLGI